MAWLTRVALAYFFFVVLGVAFLQYLARVDRHLVYIEQSPDREYQLIVSRDARIPFFLGGEPYPGEAVAEDHEGHVLDQEHFSDIRSIREIRWGRYKVYLLYNRNGHTYRAELDLAQ